MTYSGYMVHILDLNPRGPACPCTFYLTNLSGCVRAGKKKEVKTCKTGSIPGLETCGVGIKKIKSVSLCV